jgi:hypothetical protein
LLEHGRYLLLEPRSTRQWNTTIAETLWHAQESDPATAFQRSVLLADLALPTYRLHQEISRAARKAFLESEEPRLLDTFLEQGHTFFVFADVEGESLYQRIERQQLLREEEAVRALYDLARVLARLATLQPPIRHGWISPAHLIQRGVHWRPFPASVLVAGEAARFLDGLHLLPMEMRAQFHPGRDVFDAVRTVYAGLTGVLPVPHQALPEGKLPVSAPFAELLRRGLHFDLTPTELLKKLSPMVGEPAPAPRRHAGLSFSGPLAPAVQTIERSVETGQSSEEWETRSSDLARVASTGDGAARKVPRAFAHTDLPDAASMLPAYPRAADGLYAAFWSSGILVAELLLLFFSQH